MCQMSSSWFSPYFLKTGSLTGTESHSFCLSGLIPLSPLLTLRARHTAMSSLLDVRFIAQVLILVDQTFLYTESCLHVEDLPSVKFPNPGIKSVLTALGPAC